MSQALNDFAVTQKWPAQHPERLQLYSLPTPNGVKVSIMLEEIGLPYDAHTVSFERQDQMSAEFLSLNPNNKIPAILDPNGPDGKAMQLFESGAILWYLAEKTGQLIPQDAARRYECMQWLFFQVGGVGPMMDKWASSTNTVAKTLKTNARWNAMWPRASVCWASSTNICAASNG